MLDYAAGPECLPAQLCGHFGEQLPQPCGRCSNCREPQARVLPDTAPETTGEEQQGEIERLIGEANPALAHLRQLARFLCGLASPATMRLRKHPQFGSLAR
ncbi:RecQ family zinc-binding domain-containing protein [Microbulbifer rhizosphaerae]|uniref:Superfamily II DNA helicase RecQ n=1 Tax=Microbulbifer rhizosphaerae TaxID=1562603 RepID=A0A7W4WBE5_9GAMM|nr:superfamily II DNA helicase RecQ [Microbulbifer rhizosphaerae]